MAIPIREDLNQLVDSDTIWASIIYSAFVFDHPRWQF